MLIIYSIPNLNVSEETQETLRQIHREFLSTYGTLTEEYIHKEIGAYSAYYFEVPSSYYPDFKIPVLLTLYYEEHENVSLFNPIVKDAIVKLKAIPDLSKAFYISVPHTTPENLSAFGKMIGVLTDFFFEAAKKHETYTLGLAEVLMLGAKGGGKSSIVDYLVHGKFIQPTTPTLTPKVLQLIFENVDFRVLDVCCKEHVQAVFEDHPLEPGKLPQAVVYVVDTTATPEKQKEAQAEFYFWMDYLSKQYPVGRFSNIPVMVVFNKVDVKPMFEIEAAKKEFDGMKYGVNVHYATISAKTGEGDRKSVV